MDKKKRLEKRSARQERIKETLRRKLLNPTDIKYSAPLSYRHLRIIGWIAFACGQAVLLNSVGIGLFNESAFSGAFTIVLDVIANLSVPLFSIAAFGVILDSDDSFKNTLIFYGVMFLAIGLGLNFLYYRYVNGLLLNMGVSADSADVLKELLGRRVEINLFADLFLFAVFHFFTNYTPKKHFQGKRLALFRSFSALPILFVTVLYILKILTALGKMTLPFFIYPFIPTKPPMVFLVFVAISLWIKNRRKLIYSLGATEEQYATYNSSKRGSLAFSGQLSIIILLFAIVELVLFGIIALTIVASSGTSGLDAELDTLLSVCGFGECLNLLLAIPIIFLYSYNKREKNKSIDIIIPLAGIGLTALLYLEFIYNGLLHLLS